jgi:DNA topoisomerase-3
MRVEFDEPWAKEGFKEAQADDMETPAEGTPAETAASGASAAA